MLTCRAVKTDKPIVIASFDQRIVRKVVIRMTTWLNYVIL